MSEQTPSEINFNYIKSPSYRTTHIDGAFGGLTPKGHISVALFSERLPIPTSVVHAYDGVVGKELSRESRQAIIREIEINCVMDGRTARIVAEWLLKKAEELENVEIAKQ